MGFEIFLIVAGIALIGLTFWQPDSVEERKDPNDPLYNQGLVWYVESLLGGISFLGLGLAVFFDKNTNFDGGWFMLLPAVAGGIFMFIGAAMLVSKKFNTIVWKFFPAGSSPRRDRNWLASAFLLLGAVSVFVWVYLHWPH